MAGGGECGRGRVSNDRQGRPEGREGDVKLVLKMHEDAGKIEKEAKASHSHDSISLLNVIGAGCAQCTSRLH